MNKYRVTFGQNGKIVLALVLPSFLFLPIIFLCLEYLPDMGGLNVIISTLLYIGAYVATVFFLIKRTNPFADVVLEGETVKVTFEKSGILIPDNFQFNLKDVSNYWEQEDKGYAFLYLNKTGKPTHFFFRAGLEKEVEYESFIKLKNEIVRGIEIVEQNENTVIGTKTMYEQWWAKILAVFILLVIIGFPIISLQSGSENISWLKYGVLVFSGSVFIYNVYYNNFVKNKK